MSIDPLALLAVLAVWGLAGYMIGHLSGANDRERKWQKRLADLEARERAVREADRNLRNGWEWDE